MWGQESEDAFRFAQVGPGVEVGRVEFQVAEGAYGPVARGGDVLDRDGRTGVDGMGDLADVAVRQVLRVSGDDLLRVRRERHPAGARGAEGRGQQTPPVPPPPGAPPPPHV